MIPFNHLGFVFKTFGKYIYPKSVRSSLCTFLNALASESKVLDVGAGTGVMCTFANACRDDLKYSAVDPAKGMLKYAHAYIETHEGMAESLPFENDSFEAVLIGEALHHFDDVDVAFLEIWRVLKDNGRVFIYDFDVSTFMGKNICRIETLLGEPGNFYAPEHLKDTLESYGFEVRFKKHGWRYTMEGIVKNKVS